MSIKPQYETYRYTGEICKLNAQSIVECRLPGSEIGSVLAVQAKAVVSNTTCVDGEVRYGGKLLLSIVYEDGNKKICRAERGAEFYHKAESGEITPACFAKTHLTCENVSTRREGSGLYISVVVGAHVDVYGSKATEYLIGGDGLAIKKQTVRLCKNVCVSGETECEDEFETDVLGDILLHGESALATSVQVKAGELIVEGETVVNVCVLNSDQSVCSYERVVPFRMQIPCDEAFGHVQATARVQVKSATLQASVDEEKGKSKMVLSYVLSADCFLYSQGEVETACDAFSPEREIVIKRENGVGRYLTNQNKCVQRVGGTASLGGEIENDYTLLSAVLPRAEIACRKGDKGWEAEGAVVADILLGGENGYKSATLSLPFVFPLDSVGDEVEASAIVCGLNVRRSKDGKTEAEATLKLCVRSFEKGEWEYIKETVEGEEYPKTNAAISMYALREGEGLWDVAKRLHRFPNELKKSNPELTFPVKAGERIFVYRQIK